LYILITRDLLFFFCVCTPKLMCKWWGSACVCAVRRAWQPQLMWQYLLHLVGFVFSHLVSSRGRNTRRMRNLCSLLKNLPNLWMAWQDVRRTKWTKVFFTSSLTFTKQPLTGQQIMLRMRCEKP